MKNRNKKVTVIIISILIVLILLLALTYAFFRTELFGNDQIVKVGTLDLVLDETSEGISLDNAIGISDSEGLSLEGSTFKLINNGNKAVDYTIYLDDNTIGEADTRIDDKYLKYNLVKNGESSGAKLLTSIGSNPNRILDSGTIEGKSTNEYSLNLWITDEVDGDYSGQVFSGKLRVEVSQARKTVAETLLADSSNNIDTSDPDQTFITGNNPNNHIWYSGKLWRAVSVNNEAKTTKLVTQWNISAITYSSGSTAFEGSYMEDWLNDTTEDGFLGNLRDYKNFIVTDSVWDATMDNRALGEITRLDGTTTVSNAVGLLNVYEYQSSNDGGRAGYLNNGLGWWLLTPYSDSNVRYVGANGNIGNQVPTFVRKMSAGIRPSINLKSEIKIVLGSGTEEDPYRLMGDNDSNLEGVKLNTRYSGEYIRFGIGYNNLYRIVSHETEGLTKITSTEPLKENGIFKNIVFDSNRNTNYSLSTTMGTFLNGEYLTDYIGENYSNMIEDNTTWYLGIVSTNASYKLAKYTDTSSTNLTSSTTTAKVGLLRYGELMTGQFKRQMDIGGSYNLGLNGRYKTLTPFGGNWYLYSIDSNNGIEQNAHTDVSSIKPALNLKSNVIITGGTGTKSDPFQFSMN